MMGGEAAYLEVQDNVYETCRTSDHVRSLRSIYSTQYIPVPETLLGRTCPATGAADDWTEPPGEMVRH